MFTILRGIFIVLTFLKYGLTAGFTRVILAFVAFKLFTVVFFGIVLPIVGTYIMLKVNGIVMDYVLDYLAANVDLSDFPVALQLTGIGAMLFDRLGLAQALSLVTTASTIRFFLNFSSKR